MKAIKEILSIAILIMCAIMVAVTWDQAAHMGWLVALVGWIEVVVNRRKESILND